MYKKLTELQTKILIGVVDDVRRLKRQQVPEWGPYNRPKWHTDFLAARKAGAAPVDPAGWSGMGITNNAIRMAISRSYIALEKFGFIERLCLSWSGTRCTHLKPTAAGVKLAAELTKKISRAKAAARMKASASAEIGPPPVTAAERRRAAAEGRAKRAGDG